MIMLAAATILQPISWNHYLVTLLPAFCLIAAKREFRASDLVLSMFLLVLILPVYHYAANHYLRMAPWPPVLFIIGLMWLIVPKTVREYSILSKLVSARETA
jgi:hypothetical protein